MLTRSFSRLTLSSNNPAPPCKAKLQSLHLHLKRIHHEWWLQVNHSLLIHWALPTSFFLHLRLKELPSKHVWSLLHFFGNHVWQLSRSIVLSCLSSGINISSPQMTFATLLYGFCLRDKANDGIKRTCLWLWKQHKVFTIWLYKTQGASGTSRCLCNEKLWNCPLASPQIRTSSDLCPHPRIIFNWLRTHHETSDAWDRWLVVNNTLSVPCIENKCCPQWLLARIVEKRMILFLQHPRRNNKTFFTTWFILLSGFAQRASLNKLKLNQALWACRLHEKVSHQTLHHQVKISSSSNERNHHPQQQQKVKGWNDCQGHHPCIQQSPRQHNNRNISINV